MIHTEVKAAILLEALKFAKSGECEKIYFSKNEVFTAGKYYLKFAKFECEKYTENCEFTIELKYANSILKTFEGCDTVSIEKTNKYVIFRSEGKELRILKTLGELPNIWYLLPSNSEQVVIYTYHISREYLKTLIEKAYVANPKGGIIHFNLDETVAISVNGLNSSITEGENKESVRIRATQLKDLLHSIDSDRFILNITDEKKTRNVHIIPCGYENFTLLLTPILYEF